MEDASEGILINVNVSALSRSEYDLDDYFKL